MYKNVTEILVEQKLASLWRYSDCCKCSKCHDDIMSYALNRLPAKYVSTSRGELFNKASSLSLEYEVEIIKTVTMAMAIVEKYPRHTARKNVNGVYDVFQEKD